MEPVFENREISSTPWSDHQGRSTKIINRTAAMHVLVKPDCAVVLMNQSFYRSRDRKTGRLVRISDFRFHDLRHTAASWMRMKGADIQTEALILGRKDLRMAARYQHLSPAFLSDAVKLLDSAYAEKPKSAEAETPKGSEKREQFRFYRYRSVTRP